MRDGWKTEEEAGKKRTEEEGEKEQEREMEGRRRKGDDGEKRGLKIVYSIDYQVFNKMVSRTC